MVLLVPVHVEGQLLQDILEELAKPGRDPRESFEVFNFQEGVNAMADLKVGMKLPGVVTNITAFGAFVDVGVHQDGLVHLSHLADRFVKDPNEVVTVNQKVQVTVMEVDIARKRIGLSMKADPFAEWGKNPAKPAPGQALIRCTRSRIKRRYANHTHDYRVL